MSGKVITPNRGRKLPLPLNPMLDDQSLQHSFSMSNCSGNERHVITEAYTPPDPFPQSCQYGQELLTSNWEQDHQDLPSNGSLGFQCSTALGQQIGFYTNNASWYNGSAWSLFSFGPDWNYGVANFVTTLTVPGPGAAATLGLGALALGRRRRR